MCLKKLFEKLFGKSSEEGFAKVSENESIEETRFIPADGKVEKYQLGGEDANVFVACYLQNLVEHELMNANKTVVSFIDSHISDSYTESQLNSGNYYIVETPEISDLKAKIIKYKMKVPGCLNKLIGI